MFKAAANDGKQGVPYGKAFGKGDNVTVIKHNASCLEFAINGEGQGMVSLDVPMPADVVGCVSMCVRAGDPIAHPSMSLHSGPVGPITPKPPAAVPGGVHLATCDAANPLQAFVYSQEARTVSHGGRCLILPKTTPRGLPDPTAFSAVELGDCNAGTLNEEEEEQQQIGTTDLNTASAFTWAPELGYLRSVYASCNLCIGVCGK